MHGLPGEGACLFRLCSALATIMAALQCTSDAAAAVSVPGQAARPSSYSLQIHFFPLKRLPNKDKFIPPGNLLLTPHDTFVWNCAKT